MPTRSASTTWRCGGSPSGSASGRLLYKHIDGLADLQHAIATLAVTELGDAVRDALQGRSGADALGAFARAFRDYVTVHPGRHTATIDADFTGVDDPLWQASARFVDSISAVLRGYDIDEAQLNHALRTLRCAFHGFATLQSSNAFRWTGDPKESFDWMISFIDHGLRAVND